MYGSTLILDAFWVSNKPFPTVQSDITHDGKAFHKYYCGNARYLGWMDLVLLNDFIKKHNITHIILQNLDALGKITSITQELKICIAYEYHRLIIHSLTKKKELMQCKPIYQSVEFGGWTFSDEDNNLHERAKFYIRFLLIHTRVNSITCMNNKIKVIARFDDLGNVIFETQPNL